MSLATTNGRGLAVPAAMQPDQIDYGDPARPVVRYTVNDIREMADTAAKSGLANMNAPQLMTLMLLCESEGLHPMQAIRRFHIIEGRPSMRADAMQAEFQRHGGRIRWIKTTAQECEAEFSHPRFHPDPVLVRVTLQELTDNGVALGKWENGKRKIKDTYRKFPRSMLRARVISEGVRAVDPSVVVGIYTPEEVDDFQSAETVPVDAPSPRDAARAQIQGLIAGAKRPAAVEAPEPAPPRTDFGAWLETRIGEVHERWSEIARGSGIDPGKPVPRLQVANHLIKAWIDDGSLVEDVLMTGGKRDKHKVAAVLSQAWDGGPDEVKADVDDYLKAELVRRAEAAGVALPDEPTAEPAPVATDAASEAEDGDESGWELGRE